MEVLARVCLAWRGGRYNRFLATYVRQVTGVAARRASPGLISQLIRQLAESCLPQLDQQPGKPEAVLPWPVAGNPLSENRDGFAGSGLSHVAQQPGGFERVI
jgi:hypothetical protein